MKVFIGILGILLLAVVLWLFIQQPDNAGNTAPPPAVSTTETAPAPAGSSASGNGTQSEAAGANRQNATTRFSGSQPGGSLPNPAGQTNRNNGQPTSVAETYYTTDDLAVLFEQLQTPGTPEEYYFRYRILKECNDLRLRGIDKQLETCESIAEHATRGTTDVRGESTATRAEMAEACFNLTERCSNLDFESIELTPALALQEAIEQGSPLAIAANLYQLSNDDPQAAREWLAAALDEDPSAELLRHGASFLRSALRLRDEPFLGASDAASMLLAERALDLTACRLDAGCNPGGRFMLERCNYLPGCLPWQSYEQWLFQTYNTSPDDLNAVLELSQDYQQLLLNRQAELLVFPDLPDESEADSGTDAETSSDP